MTVHSQKYSLSVSEKYYKFQQDKMALAGRFDGVPFLCGAVTENCWHPWAGSQACVEHLGAEERACWDVTEAPCPRLGITIYSFKKRKQYSSQDL